MTTFIIAGVIGVVLLCLVACGLFLYTSVGRFAGQWEQQNKQAVDADSATMVVFGDSTAQGVGASSIGRSFVRQVATSLDQNGQPVQVYNYSKSGAVAADLAGQVARADKLADADVILVAVGPNDLNRGVEQASYLKEYQQFLDKLPKAKVVLATIPPLVRGSVSDATVAEWNTKLLAMAAKNKVRTAPVYDAIHPRRYDPLIYSVDLLHPSNIGYGLWAGAFYGPAYDVVSADKRP